MSRTHDGERGAVAVILAVVIVVLLGASAIAVDAGQIWSNRRSLVTATDAAALAAAHTYANDGDGCASDAATKVSENVSSAEMTSCVSNIDGIQGTVTVAAHNEAELFFAQIWGETSRDSTSSTTAEWGYPSSVIGLRPFAVCVDSPAFLGWTDKTQPYGPVVVTYGKSQVNACGSAPGNWGVIDFDGGNNSNADTQDWVQNGYDGAVTAPGYYPGNTGVFPSNSLDLDSLIGQTFPIPLFDAVSNPGSNASFHLVGFASVTLHAVQENGVQATRSLTLTFRPGIVQGTCCGTPIIDTGIRVVGICAVDPNTSCS